DAASDGPRARLGAGRRRGALVVAPARLLGLLTHPCLARRGALFDGTRVAVAHHGHVRLPAVDRAEHETGASTVAGRHAADVVGAAEGDRRLARAADLERIGAHA